MLSYTGTERRPVVEFAIENAQALKKRALRQTRVQEQSVGKRAPQGASEAREGGAASHKQQRKRKREDSEVSLDTCPRKARDHFAAQLRCYTGFMVCSTTRTQVLSWVIGQNASESMACLQAPQKAAREPADGQTPKEGRGQRQRRRKREGAGAGGQAGQTSGQPEQTGTAASKGPGRPKAASTISAGNDRGQEAAGREPVGKKLRATSPDTGILQAPCPLRLGMSAQHSYSRQISMLKVLMCRRCGYQRDPVAAGGQKAKKQKSVQKGVAEKTDRLDSMVAQYKQQLFGGAAGSKTVKSSLQRWFE